MAGNTDEKARTMAFLKGERIVAGEQKGMLPGVAGICMWMLVVATVGVFGALNGVYAGHARFVVLPVCTMIVIGVFGLLRLKRWGWAMVLAGTLLLSFGYGFMATTMRQPGFWVMSLLNLCFFLYLSRTEVRERMRI
jgi:hypothetical protein